MEAIQKDEKLYQDIRAKMPDPVRDWKPHETLINDSHLDLLTKVKKELDYKIPVQCDNKADNHKVFLAAV